MVDPNVTAVAVEKLSEAVETLELERATPWWRFVKRWRLLRQARFQSEVLREFLDANK